MHRLKYRRRSKGHHPIIPRSAVAFADFMTEVWGAESEPTPDGGMVVYQSPLYDRFHNARANAQRVAVRTGGTHIDGNPAEIWQFPDGTRVIVARDGTALAPTNKPLVRRRKRKPGTGSMLDANYPPEETNDAADHRHQAGA